MEGEETGNEFRSVFRHEGFGVELNPHDGVAFVGQAHDHTVFPAVGQDFQ
jgi:hypothetical protein